MTLGVLYYQRRTGPTRPMRVGYELQGESLKAKLVRSGTTGEPAKVEVPARGVGGVLHWRRYPTDHPYEAQPMRTEGDQLVGTLPSQPPAGKVEYFVELQGDDSMRLPSAEEGTVVLRYKGAVPPWILAPHIILISLAILLGFRTGLSALLGRAGTKTLSWFTFVVLTVGGMILGPVVQLHAFGALWTGWPFGEDLTDNKTLVMWLAWLVAAIVVSRGGGVRQLWRRAMVIVALLVMLAVVLIPHSARGSELDYDQLDEGIDPAEAIRTG
jgi:hypothetical protein